MYIYMYAVVYNAFNYCFNMLLIYVNISIYIYVCVDIYAFILIYIYVCIYILICVYIYDVLCCCLYNYNAF